MQFFSHFQEAALLHSFSKRRQHERKTRHALALLLAITVWTSSVIALEQDGAIKSTNREAQQPEPLPHDAAYDAAHKQYDAHYKTELQRCQKKLAPAQCSRQARLAKEKAEHFSKLTRNQARQAYKQEQVLQNASNKKQKLINKSQPTASQDSRNPMLSKKSSTENGSNRTPMLAPPQKNKQNAAEKKAKEITERKRKVAENTAKTKARNEKRAAAGYPVDDRKAP